MEKNERQIFNDFVTLICKECATRNITLKELDKAVSVVREFYYDNAVPYENKRD